MNIKCDIKGMQKKYINMSRRSRNGSESYVLAVRRGGGLLHYPSALVSKYSIFFCLSVNSLLSVFPTGVSELP